MHPESSVDITIPLICSQAQKIRGLRLVNVLEWTRQSLLVQARIINFYQPCRTGPKSRWLDMTRPSAGRIYYWATQRGPLMQYSFYLNLFI